MHTVVQHKHYEENIKNQVEKLIIYVALKSQVKLYHFLKSETFMYNYVGSCFSNETLIILPFFN